MMQSCLCRSFISMADGVTLDWVLTDRICDFEQLFCNDTEDYNTIGHLQLLFPQII